MSRIAELDREIARRRVGGAETVSAPILLGGKALTATELQSGDLELVGYGVVWEGLDAEGENFVRGSIRDALPAWLTGHAPLCWNHDSKSVIGKVLEAREDDTGLYVRARIDFQQPTSPLRWIYDAARRGTAKGLSLQGVFHRAARSAITKVLRIVELSLTATPVHALTNAQVTEVKALMGGQQAAEGLECEYLRLYVRAMQARVQLLRLEADLARHGRR